MATISCIMRQGEHKYRDFDLLRSPYAIEHEFQFVRIVRERLF